jgi:hypothetical protein
VVSPALAFTPGEKIVPNRSPKTRTNHLVVDVILGL